MGSTEGTVEIDVLERRLLSDDITREDSETEEEEVLYRASFQEMEDNYVKHQTAQWILYSVLLILAWGIGLLMLLYLPIRRHILRKDFQSRKLYITPDAIVYKVTRPMLFPCFGVLKKEKYILLPSVADIVVEQGACHKVNMEQLKVAHVILFPPVEGDRPAFRRCLDWLLEGYLQSHFGIYSIRIENAGVRRPPSDDVKIQGIVDPTAFRKAVLNRVSNLRNESIARQVSTSGDQLNIGSGYPSAAWVRQAIGTGLTLQPMSPLRYLRQDSFQPAGEQLLRKIEEVGSSVKRVETLIEEWHGQTSEPLV